MDKLKKTEEISLWIEGFRMFGRFWRPWVREGLWFFLVLALLNIVLVIDGHEAGLGELGMNHRDLTPAEAAKAAPIFLTGIIAGFVVGLVQTYVFSIFYLRREPIVGAPKPSWKGFFYFCGVYVQIILLILGIAATAGIIVVIAGFLRHLLSNFIVDTLMIAVCMSGLGLMYYMMIRILPAFTFAASGIRSPLMASWHLLRGNWWRFFGNMLIMMLLIAVPMLGAISAAVPIKELMHGQGENYLPAGIVISILNAAVQVAMTGIFTAFTCAACRILYTERREEDPSFVLTMPS